MRLGYALDDPDFYLGDVHAVYRELRQEAPVYWCESGRFWALSKYENILYTSRHPETFCSSRGVLTRDALRGNSIPGPPPSILYMDPPVHNRYRKLVSTAFTPRMVKALEPRIRQIIGETLDALPVGEVVDFVENVAIPIPILVIAEILGVPGQDRAAFKRWSDAAIVGADAGSAEAHALGLGELFGYFQSQLEQRRRDPRTDLISSLAAAEVDGERLSEFDLLSFCLTLLVAGNETTRNLISGGARALMEFPEEKRKLAADPSLIPDAIEEMLRWVTPVRAFARTATVDTEIRGQTISAGDYVLMLYESGNRDEEAWGKTADRFEVTRPPVPGQLAFGFGEHQCLGANLARMEARFLFEELLRRFADVALAGEIEPLRSTVFNGIVHMPVRFSNRFTLRYGR
jgi:cytochrome P450